jgi:energy-coupling factor transport system ATP-binding protein
MAEVEKMIEIKTLTFRYNQENTDALRDISLNIGDGEFILLTGNSGSGKSTFVRTFNGLVPHFYGGKIRGSILINGKNPLDLSVRAMAEEVGYVFQIPDNQIVMNMVENEIVFGMENLHFPIDIIKKRLEETLDAVGIAHLRNRNPNELSGGEKQKVAIASILCLHPKILVLDEPTSELDPKSAEEILTLLQKLNNELGMTIILIEHRTERILPFIDRIILMEEGKIILDNTPQEFFLQIQSQIGISIPPIVEFFKHLKHPHLPLNIKESRQVLRDKFNSLRINTERYNTLQQRWQQYRSQNNLGEEVLATKSLYYAYNRADNAIEDLSLTFNANEFVAIIGRNGSGKSTFLKLLTGLLSPKKGQIFLRSKKLNKIKPEDQITEFGYLFQNPSLHFYHDTVFEEVEFVLKNKGMPSEKRKVAVTTILQKLGLERYAQSYPRYLSVGEQQRVALASIMVAEPKILLLDEPTHGMDFSQKHDFFQLMEAFRQAGGLVIMVSHDIETIARYAHRVIILSDGKIVVDDETHNVLSNAMMFSPQINRLIQNFTHLPNNILTCEELMGILEIPEKMPVDIGDNA